MSKTWINAFPGKHNPSRQLVPNTRNFWFSSKTTDEYFPLKDLRVCVLWIDSIEWHSLASRIQLHYLCRIPKGIFAVVSILLWQTSEYFASLFKRSVSDWQYYDTPASKSPWNLIVCMSFQQIFKLDNFVYYLIPPYTSLCY